ncbi:MAG: hypothetical protein ABSF59_17445 [Candidatus Sulfotelmatobacter sp.]|jgi:hypothetical protein
MPTPRKSTRIPRAAAESAEVTATFVPVYSKSIERLAELQKKSLEAAAEQNAEILSTWKKAFPFVTEGPASFWFDLAGQSFERYVETQKGAIDLAVEQSATLVGLAEERGALAAKFADSGTALLQQTVDHSVAAHKKNLEFCAEQQKAGYETAKKQLRFSNPFAEAFQSGLDLLVETQKTVLDIASKPARHAAA